MELFGDQMPTTLSICGVHILFFRMFSSDIGGYLCNG